MAFIYDLSDTWNNAGISFSGIKINVTDSASAAGSKLLDLQIGSASKFTVGKTGTVIATGLIESTVGDFKFPDGTTQTTKATVNSVSGTGTVNGITLTGTVTDSGSLTLGGTLGNIANSQLTNSAITINGTSTPLGGSIAVGTVTSVAGTGTVNGLTLTGSVTTSGSLTLGGTLGNIANSQLTNSAITINGTSTALGGSISVGTVTSVAALTLGTSGTDLASSVANGTTTPVITLNVPTASATNRGALSSSDWSTFNAKQAALVSGTNIKTVGGASLLGSGDVGTIGLAYGGTGATTASGARTALGLGTAAVLNAGVAGGVATLDGSGTVPTSQLPGAVLGGLNYQGTWNASTNTPTLASSTGSKGHYYVVSVAGSTNLNGITDWKIGDWAVYDGTTWQKVDNTDAVSSVNGFTGAVVLTTSDVAQGTNLYFTQAAARGSVSAGTGISYNSGTGVITNSAPDQTVALTGAGTTVVTGTYPNFTITSNDSTVGTVTSVSASGGTTGLTFTGSPITTAGTLTLGGTLDLDNGGTGATTATGARTALGLGTAATTDASAYATAAQGAKADTAVQTIASADGSVVISGTTAIDLSVAVAGATSNVLLPIRNTTGATLTKGTAVYISGATGQLSTVSKAIANSDATSAQTLGLVTANIANNANGNVTLIGTITNIDTSAYTDGQQLYLSPTTAGTLTATKPYAPQHLVYMAVVEHAHPSQGKLFVKVQNGYEMDELHDVSAQSPTNGQTIVYNSTTGLWEKNTVSLTAGVNGTLPVANGGTGATSLTSGYLVKGNGTSAVSASVVYDNGTNVGIGTSSPQALFTISSGSGTKAVWQTTRSFTVNRNFQLAVDEYNEGQFTITPSTAIGGSTYTTPVVAINASGSVGIGTSSVSAIFGTTVRIFNAGSGGTLQIGGSTVNTYLFASEGLGLAALGVTSNHPLTFGTNDTERMRITAAGNVGIGTTSPSGKLQVEASNSRLLIGSGGSDNYYDADFHIFRGALSASAPERMRIDNSGNVGIGTSAPQRPLHVFYDSGVVGAYTAVLQGRVGGYGAGVSFQSVLTGGSLAEMARITADGESSWNTTASTQDAGLRFYTALDGTVAEKMRLDASGNVGIGTSSPSSKLTVASSNVTVNAGYGIAFTGDQNRIITPDDGSFGALIKWGATGGCRFFESTTERMRIDNAGNVGIGTTAVELGGSFKNVILEGGSGGIFQAQTTSGAQKMALYADSSAGYVGTRTNHPVLVVQNNTERMRIASDGTTTLSIGGVSSTHQFNYNESGGEIQLIDSTGAGPILLDNVSGLARLYKVGTGAMSIGTTGANYLQFITNGSERVRIDSSGNVGIGMSSPATKLDVDGIIRASNSGALQRYLAASNSAGTFEAGVVPDGRSYAGSVTNNPFMFYTNAAERMRIDTGGNLLVGTTSAQAGSKVQVRPAYASGTFFSAYCALPSATAGGGGLTMGAVDTDNAQIASGSEYYSAGLHYSFGTTASVIAQISGNITFSTNTGLTSGGTFTPTERMRIDASGNVGIGVSNPGAYGNRLGVGSPSDTSTNRIGILTQYATCTLIADGATAAAGAQLDASWANGGQGPLRFTLTNSEKMRIAANGCVNIGGTGSDATLMVSAGLGGFDRLTQMSPNSASKNAFNIMSARNSSNADLWWSWGVRNDSVWALQEGVNYSLNGSLGFYYDGAGQAFKSGGGSWASTSDVRVKTNIAPISDAASRIMALKPSSFDYRVPEAHAGRVADRGFIAQDFEKVYPHSVSESAMVADAEQAFVTGDDKIKAISLNNDFFADLVALVQEQQTTIQELTARVAQLEGN